MEEKKTIAEWEEELSFMIINLGDRTPDSKLTRDEFMADLPNLQGVDHQARRRILASHGLPETRDNMRDHTIGLAR